MKILDILAVALLMTVIIIWPDPLARVRRSRRVPPDDGSFSARP